MWGVLKSAATVWNVLTLLVMNLLKMFQTYIKAQVNEISMS